MNWRNVYQPSAMFNAYVCVCAVCNNLVSNKNVLHRYEHSWRDFFYNVFTKIFIIEIFIH